MEHHVLEHILDGREGPTNLPLSLLKNITDNFSEEREIGHGGFATVYKGVLPNGIVAVKRIRNSHTIDEKLFYREVNSLLTINQPNIVRFLGYCASTDQTAIQLEGSREHIYAEIRERLLCFEYISNGNLQKHITDELRGLDWSTRYQVIKGICDGLHYLHMEKRIYHMDLKPDNILLDNDMVPKITDFGLSRLDEKSQTMSLDRCGSLGYCAPEYLHRGKMSFKSDIYSLGIIIIELVTGEKSIPNNNRNNVLRRWRHRWRKTEKGSPLSYQQVTTCIDIGLLCQEFDPCNRPFIWEIVRDINIIKGTNSQIINDNEFTVGQISPYSEDDMLGIEPLELHFPFELNKEMSCSLWLTNETDSYIAFEVQKMSPLPYCTEPHEGIVPPRSKCSVDITLQPQDKAPEHADQFIVRSTRVNYDFTTEHITTAMFNKATGNDVDEVNLDVVFDPEVIIGSSVILDVNPLELLFRFEPNKRIPCSLHLTNNTDKDVAFGLMEKMSNDQACFISNLPMYAIVAPRTTYTLVVTTNKFRDLPKEENIDLIVKNSIVDFSYLGGVDKYFRNAEALGNTVHKLTLKAVFAPQEATTFESVPPLIQIISVEDNTSTLDNCIYFLDVNPTEPSLIASYTSGGFHMRDYDTQRSTSSMYIPQACKVSSITRKGWFVAGSYDGFIRVYNYKKKMQKIKSIRAHDSYISSIAIHPTQSYVLSASMSEIKLWDWDHILFGWKCIRKFKENSPAVAFNREDYNIFASASYDTTIKVWSLDSRKSKYTLSGNIANGSVSYMDFFTRDGQQYLITSSDLKAANIWDLQKKECVHTLPHRSYVKSVLPHPKLPVLLTGTKDGHVYLWSSINFRLKRILNIGGLSEVTGLACLIESGRIFVAHKEGLSVIEISDEEEQGASSSSKNENSVLAD